MATKSGTKTAASRSLDYTLRSDILDRVKEAGRTTGKDRDGGRDGLSNLSTTIQKGAESLLETKAEVQENIKRKENEALEAKAKFEESFEALGARSSWATPELFEQFSLLEEEKQEEYNQAIINGDKTKQESMLKAQQNRSAQLQTWKGLVMNTQDLYNGTDKTPPMFVDNMSDEDRKIIEAINTQKSARIKYNASGDMVFNVDGREITTKEYQDIVERNQKPLTQQANWMQSASSLETLGITYPKASWSEYEKQELSKNKNLITKSNLKRMMGYDFTDSGASFIDDFMAIENKLTWTDENKDGTITKEEIIKAMEAPENFKLAQLALAEYATAKSKLRFDRGQKTGASNKSKY